jgi:hypothetical protein
MEVQRSALQICDDLDRKSVRELTSQVFLRVCVFWKRHGALRFPGVSLTSRRQFPFPLSLTVRNNLGAAVSLRGGPWTEQTSHHSVG